MSNHSASKQFRVLGRRAREALPASRKARRAADAAEKKTRPKPSRKKAREPGVDIFRDVEDVSVAVVSMLHAGWPGNADGWAMLRGLTIQLFYWEFARAYGMRSPPYDGAWPELATVLPEARRAIQALPLADLTPEHFGHVHETLVGYGLVDGCVVPTNGRRANGAHFTPAYLADEVAWTTIEPLLNCMRSDDKLTAEQHLSAERLLSLRIADPAVGAGAFPLALMRRLGQLVLDAGGAATLNKAKALVALQCCIGVDKDRYGAYACRLAMTLECRIDFPGTPGSWLDHRIKHGDSLVGLDSEQILAFAWKRGREPMLALSAVYKQAIDSAAKQVSARAAELSRFVAGAP